MKRTIVYRLAAFATALLLAIGVLCAAGCGEKEGNSSNADVALEMQYQLYTDNGSIVEVPGFKGASPGVEEANSAVLADLGDYIDPQGWNAPEENCCWFEIKTYPVSSDKYVQAAMTAIVYPNYGTDGDLFSFCYSREKGRLITPEEALASVGLTVDEVEATVTQLAEQSFSDGEQVTGLTCDNLIFDGEEPIILAQICVSNRYGENWDRFCTYRPASGELTEFMGLLIPAELCDKTDPPLWVATSRFVSQTDALG